MAKIPIFQGALKRLGVHKGHVIAQAQMVLFLAGVALLLDLVFVPYVLIGPYGTAVGVLIVVLLQTILFLYRKTEKRPRGDGEGSFGSDSSLGPPPRRRGDVFG